MSDTSVTEEERRSTERERAAIAWGCVAGVVLPIAGVLIAIVLLIKGRGAHGAAVLISSVVGWCLIGAGALA